MKRKILLAVLMLCALPLASHGTESEMPLPTPEPWEMAEYGIPAFQLYTQGIALQQWMEDFLTYCGQRNIPVESDAFRHITEFVEDPEGQGDAAGRSFGVYRLLSGGAEVFLYAVDGNTAISFYAALDVVGMRRPAMRDALATYFPLVMRACLYASESGHRSEAELDVAMACYGDVPALILEETPAHMDDALAQGRYSLDANTQGNKGAWFSGHWQDEMLGNRSVMPICGFSAAPALSAYYPYASHGRACASPTSEHNLAVPGFAA